MQVPREKGFNMKKMFSGIFLAIFIVFGSCSIAKAQWWNMEGTRIGNKGGENPMPTPRGTAKGEIRVTLKWGDPVLRRDSLSQVFSGVAEEVTPWLKSWDNELVKYGGKSEEFRNLMYRMMTTLNFPQGFVVEEIELLVSGQRWKSYSPKNYWFMILMEEGSNGKPAANYYHASEGWRMKDSNARIISFARPTIFGAMGHWCPPR